METINKIAAMINGEIKRVRYTFQGQFVGYGFDIVKPGTGGKHFVHASGRHDVTTGKIWLCFEPRYNRGGKYWRVTAYAHTVNQESQEMRRISIPKVLALWEKARN